MLDINLIPKSRYVFRDYVKFTLISGLIISFSVFVIFFGVVDPLRRKNYAEQAFNIHTGQMGEHIDVEADNAALNVRLEELRLRKEALPELFVEKLPKSVIMEKIDGAVPGRVQIDNIVYGDGLISFQGNAPSPVEVADFSIGLTQTGLFSVVRIISIERELEGGQHSFVILSRLMGIQ